LVNADSNSISYNNVSSNGAEAVVPDDAVIGLDSIALYAGLGAGIWLDPSFNNELIGNNVFDNSGIGLLLQGSDDTTISDRGFQFKCDFRKHRI
jgi:parallel beta-helix repeat protein